MIGSDLIKFESWIKCADSTVPLPGRKCTHTHANSCISSSIYNLFNITSSYLHVAVSTKRAAVLKMFTKLWRPCRCSQNSKVNHLRNGSGKRCTKCFEKLVSEDSWNERVKCMRVPDWIYLLFKPESRTVADEACKNWAKIQGFLCKLIFDLKTFW